MTLVVGGNVQNTGVSINPRGQKTIGWDWINCKGDRGRRMHWWISEAIKQGAQQTRGTYHFNRFTGRLRALNVYFTGDTDLMNSLQAVIDNRI